MTRKTPLAGLAAASPAANFCTAAAAPFTGSLDSESFPPDGAWGLATSIRFDSDWQGQNEDPKRQTEARLLWTHATLYLQFVAGYRVITVFDDADSTGRRDKLWERDVVECFLQPDHSDPLHYYEFEVSPNGFWIDLDISHGQLRDLKSGLQHRVRVDKHASTWTAELAIPMKSLVQNFDPGAIWRVNFFRVEGPVEPRFYSAWQPTDTPQPNFHVPERFGYLKFELEGR
jgi:Carbohydrate family 9 binding domain-like